MGVMCVFGDEITVHRVKHWRKIHYWWEFCPLIIHMETKDWDGMGNKWSWYMFLTQYPHSFRFIRLVNKTTLFLLNKNLFSLHIWIYVQVVWAIIRLGKEEKGIVCWYFVNGVLFVYFFLLKEELGVLVPCRADVFASDLVAVVLVVLVVVLAAGAARRTCRGFLGQPLPLSKCAFHWLSVGGSIAVIQRGQHTSLSLRAITRRKD